MPLQTLTHQVVVLTNSTAKNILPGCCFKCSLWIASRMQMCLLDWVSDLWDLSDLVIYPRNTHIHLTHIRMHRATRAQSNQPLLNPHTVTLACDSILGSLGNQTAKQRANIILHISSNFLHIHFCGIIIYGQRIFLH